jgi:glycosyltransferase involved in cell wall biosynthesis
MVRTLARGLSREGIETHVATTDDNGRETLDVPCGVPVHEDGVTYWYFDRQTRFYTFSWPLSTWLARHIAEFDVVHVHALFSYATLPAAFWSKRYEVPYVVRPLGTLSDWGMKNRRPWLKKLSFNLLERRILEHAAVVHYTSEQERTEAERLYITAAGTVIPNALPDSTSRSTAGRFRARYPILRDRRIILFLARLDPKKGLDLLMRAFAEIRRNIPDASLVLAGDGEANFVRSLKSDAAALGIASEVLWPGFLSGAEKDAALADADVYALPSYSENFGISVVEALAAGVPVIVSDQVGIHPEISRARAGAVVACDVPELAGALTTLLTSPVLRRAMGEHGRALVRQKYSSAAVTQRLIGLYNQIVH